MDSFLQTPSKSASSSSTPYRHRKATKHRMTSSSAKSRKTIFESSSEDEHTFSSYSGYSRSTRSTGKSPYEPQVHRYESNGENSSSSDLDVAQMEDFKPLIPKNKKPQRSSQRMIPPKSSSSSSSHHQSMRSSNQSHNQRTTALSTSSTTTTNNKFRKRANDQFDRTKHRINGFQNEIESLKAKNRGSIHSMNSSNSQDRRTNSLMSQIQHEHEEQEEVLEDMQTVLERLNIMSQDIGNEIAEQDGLIQETQDHADYAREKMKRVEAQMNELMRKNGLTPCKMIMILGCIAVVLVIIILNS